MLAKSKQYGGTELVQHLSNVGHMCKYMSELSNITNNLKHIVILCGLLHDIGKCTEEYQKFYSTDKEYDNEEDVEEIKYRHNIVAWAYLKSKNFYINGEKLTTDKKQLLINPILYHHSVYCNDVFDETVTNGMVLESIGEVTIKELDNIISYISEITNKEFGFTFECTNGDYDNDTKITNFLDYSSKNDLVKQLTNFSKITLVRNILISADRYASKMESENIPFKTEYVLKYINVRNVLTNEITPLVENLDEKRWVTQNEKAKESANHDTSLMLAPAGFGKTLVGLLWHYYLNNNRKLLWVTPQNSIAENCYHSIVSDLQNFGFGDLKVGLLLTNQYIHGDENCDIIVTNIDNWLRPTFKGDKEINSFELLYENVVFDEFHLNINDAALYSAFIALVRARNILCNSVKTLLLSATPIKPLINYWDSTYKTHVVNCDSHIKEQKYKVTFDVDNLKNETNVLRMYNSIKQSQQVLKDTGYDMLIHSDFTIGDYDKKIETLYKFHGKNGDYLNTTHNVVATRCASTSLNLSFKHCFESVCSPEYSIQTIGRVGRFGECINDIIEYNIVNNNSQRVNKSEFGAIKILYDNGLCDKWYNYFKGCIPTDGIITNGELYEIYNSFNEKYETDIFKYIENKLKSSLEAWSDITTITNGKGMGSEQRKTIRGNNSTIYISPLDNVSETEFIDDIISCNTGNIGKVTDIELNSLKNKSTVSKIMNKLLKLENKRLYLGNKTEDTLRVIKKDDRKISAFVDGLISKAKKPETPLFILTKRYNSKFGLYDRNLTQFNT